MADRIIIPMLLTNGGLAGTFNGRLMGVGSRRGIGLILICLTLLMMLVSVGVFANPRIRNLEQEIPDAIGDA